MANYYFFPFLHLRLVYYIVIYKRFKFLLKRNPCYFNKQKTKHYQNLTWKAENILLVNKLYLKKYK